ncbi:MAG: protein-S-isoprenylcysteine O-methyltransferase [Coriobacteriia bacterium]|nr:protein-S-isoprenylcysteine O-methyltransferase [Coriobacteriia bacterium]
MPEYVFRIAAFLLLLVYRVIRKVWERRLAAHLTQRPTMERRPIRERWLLGVMGVLMVPTLLYCMSTWVDFAHVPLPEWSRWTGAVITVGGIWLFSLTHTALAQNWSPLLEVREGNTLITSGPYHLVRHPMYSAGLVVNIGISLLCANWLAATGLIAGLLIVVGFRVRDEERMMIDAFGDEYRAYMARTGRLLPKLGYLLRLQNRNDR